MAASTLLGLAEQRNQVKKLLEWQRHTHVKHAGHGTALQNAQDVDARPTVDVEDALRSSFEVLLPKDSYDHVLAGSATESDAFQIISMAVQLQQYELSEDVQENIAEIVYRLWASTSPGVACRSLLEAMLARKSHNEATPFVECLLRILQQTLTIGNKRSLQILYYLFDALDQEKLEQTFPDLTDKLAQCISSQAGGQHAARILGKLAVQKSKDDPLRLLDFLKPFVAQETYRAKQAVHENLLPPILSQVPALQEPLLDWLRTEASTSTNHLFALLSLARLDDDASKPVNRFDDLIATSIVHEDPLIRFEALRLLSSLPSGTAPSRRFNLHHLKLHMMFWKYNLADSDSPAVRTGLIGEWKHFIVRARLSSNAAKRVVTKSQTLSESSKLKPEIEEARAYLNAMETFFRDWVEYTVKQLLPVKPYRCHISSLIFLQILLESGLDPQYKPPTSPKVGKTREVVTWPFEITIITSSLIEDFITCIRSTYDDVRTIACTILGSISLEESQAQLIYDLGFSLVQRKREADIASATLYLRLASSVLLSSPSLTQSYDAVDCTIPKLLDMLDTRLRAFQQNFADAADQSPVHGILQAVAHLLQTCFSSNTNQKTELQAISRRCVKAIYTVWEITKSILCRQDLNSAEDADDVGAEDSVVLNASWRSIKEASNLLSIVLALPLSLRVSVWTCDELAEHASLFATWLLEIGHRGVFAHVSNAYNRLCVACIRSKSPEAQLPAGWLKSHLTQILEVERPAARRSAGLPYLLLGVISCFSPQASEIKSAFEILISSAAYHTKSSNTIRTHAIHCLRVLLLDGKLSVATKPYIRAGFSIAINGFGNKHWGIRNASLLLYASLIQRLFSNRRENHLPLARRTSIVDFFSQYEGLVPDLVEALSSGLERSEPEALGSVFSVLLLLSLLATPSDSSRASELASAFYPLVDACSASPVWKVRDASAAALTGLIPEIGINDHCTAILRSCEAISSTNELHGRLLQVHALLATLTESHRTLTAQDDDGPWKEILACLDRAMHRDMPLPVLTQALEILALSTVRLSDAISAKVHSLACRHYGQRRPGYTTYSNALTRVLLKTEPARYLEKCLVSQYSAAQAETLAYLRNNHVNVDHHLSLQELLFQVANSPETTLANKTVALELLAERRDLQINDEHKRSIFEQYASNDVPAIRQALLPLLARSIHTPYHPKDISIIRKEISKLGEDESNASREAACRSMFTLENWMKDEPFRYAYQLLRFLQDDDLDVRILAGLLASKHFAQHQPVCTSRAIELTWQKCLDSASAEDLEWLANKLVSQLEQTIEDAEAGSQLLFAVERANMHIDIVIDLEKSAECFTQRKSGGSTLGEEILARLKPLEERLDKLKADTDNKASPSESNQISNAYTFVQAKLIVRALRRAI